MDLLEPQFWVEHKARMEEEEHHEALAEQQRADKEREREERKKRTPERAVSGSVVDDHVVWIKGYAGADADAGFHGRLVAGGLRHAVRQPRDHVPQVEVPVQGRGPFRRHPLVVRPQGRGVLQHLGLSCG